MENKDNKLFVKANIAMLSLVVLIILAYFFVIKPNNKPVVETGTGIVETTKETKENNTKTGKTDTTVKDTTSGSGKVVNNVKKGNGLDDIAKDVETDAEKTAAEILKKKEENKKIIGEYLNTINADKNVLTHISQKSIDKIKKETTDTYNLFTKEDKDNFLLEIKEIGYPKETFDVKQDSDLNDYINTIIKSGLKQDGKIVDFNIIKTEEVKDEKNNTNLTYVEYLVKFEGNKEKTLKVFLDKDKKLQISL